LADARGSGPCDEQSWGFESLHPHHVSEVYM